MADTTSAAKAIFVATHPRACSTAFERVFMTRPDTLRCVHEPFGDAFYFGPERLSPRYEHDERAREESGFAESTYKTVFERIEREGNEGKRLFIKDIVHYLVPPEGKPATLAPSLIGQTATKGGGTLGAAHGTNGEIDGATDGHRAHGRYHPPYPYDTPAEPGNPTVVPAAILRQFHFTFLIRHPRHSIPSYYRCTIPPLDAVTGFHHFMPSEAGYDELRRVFDFLVHEKQVGPAQAGEHGDRRAGEVSITVIDADDLLDHPADIVGAYCKEVGLEYTPDMLVWDTAEDHQRARDAFEKWRGFHDDAINSTSLKPRSAGRKQKSKTVEAEDQEWKEKYGEEGARVIRECVQANLADYEYLKGFAIKV